MQLCAGFWRLRQMDSSDSNDDRHLVEQIQRGDQTAFRQFVDGHKDKVSGYIYRLIPDDSDREEVCQDVFIKAYYNLKDFRFDSKISTWLYRIAWHSAISHLRKHRKRRQVMVEDESEIPAEYPDAVEGEPSDFIGDRELFDLVNRKISGLPVEERNILSLYHFLEMTIAEISEITTRPVGTIKSDLFRIRKKLKQQIQSSVVPMKEEQVP